MAPQLPGLPRECRKQQQDQITQRTHTLVYSPADIRRLDIATGSRRNVLHGLRDRRGNRAAGAVVLLLAHHDDGDTGYLEGLEYLGAGATGALIKSPRWTRVRPAGLGVSISF